MVSAWQNGGQWSQEAQGRWEEGGGGGYRGCLYPPVETLIMGMEGQAVAAAHGGSLSSDYRVCAGHRGLITDMRWQVSVCM